MTTKITSTWALDSPGEKRDSCENTLKEVGVANILSQDGDSKTLSRSCLLCLVLR
jgi:hypothetical protein